MSYTTYTSSKPSPSSIAERIVLNPSLTMSLYCYSILRLDPYVGCSFNCKYCFVKSLPGARGIPRPIPDHPKLLEKVLISFSETPLLDMPYRLSALTDPLQPIEEKMKYTYEILRLADKNNLKILLSTKSALVVHEPWIGQILRLAEKHSITVQVTLTTLDEKLSRCLEPGAPPPEERLKTIEVLDASGVPVVVRLQPLIPYINDGEEELEYLLSSVAAAGARQVIAEYYRFLSERELKDIAHCTSKWSSKSRLFDKRFWEVFPSGSQKRPLLHYRRAKYFFLKERAKSNKILFSICREGLYNLWTAPDCCGIHFMKNYRLKPTLREIMNGEYGRNPLYIEKKEFSSVPYVRVRRKIYKYYEILKKYKNIGYK